ncbi:hypothetical protein ACQPWW_23410 [Micromonospora sp. CA-240977]|uniref:hypothetical protein n=1 Tax=Micromonospora sp. CA-240977 TaxID=3239957 RepID=UPI003D89FF0F
MAFLLTPAGPEQLFLLFGDDPLSGHQPELWTPERFTPALIALNEQLGNIVIPE